MKKKKKYNEMRICKKLLPIYFKKLGVGKIFIINK